MGKHAYLLLAHKCDYNLKTLVKMLDYKDNDIYIHMDMKLEDYNKGEIESLVKKSNIYHVKRIKTQWGAYSLIEAELILLEEASKNHKYDYYHLISGQDLPLKKQKDIHDFFDKNKGKEFVAFQSETFQLYNRIRYYYPFIELLGRKIFRIRKLLIIIQKLFIKRNKNISFQKGDQWFSITDEFTRYIICKKDWIKKVFKSTFCSDEVFLQTLLINSKFKNNLYYNGYGDSCKAIMRYIDWNRAKPYVFRKEDFDELINSGALFARKFDCNIDKDIINDIYNYVKNIV